mmetsp:Transcript_35242/g.61547  ORF Transcript_35242/g.61547 Transcript_35242/m.61547 type:complete len:144 (-) Transcript_35242:179-610(-)
MEMEQGDDDRQKNCSVLFANCFEGNQIYPDNDFELAIKLSRKIGKILDNHFDATGNTLQEKLSSCQKKMPTSLKMKLHYLAKISDKLIFERAYDRIPNRDNFIMTYEDTQHELNDMLQQQGVNIVIESDVAFKGQKQDDCIIS